MNYISKLKRKIFSPAPKAPDAPLYAGSYLQVFSHPRSGTHFLEAFIGENFYKDEDLFLPGGNWGHWANRKKSGDGNLYGKLFGSHWFPSKHLKKIDYPSVYIYRNGKAVAYSIWKTENFLNPKYEELEFSEFLKLTLDWTGSPAFKTNFRYTIAQHWDRHLHGWLKMAKNNPNILVVNYEELVDNPYSVYKKLHSSFFSDKPLLKPSEVDVISNPVGLKPNRAKKDSWKEVFNEADNSLFESQVKYSGTFLLG